MKTTSKTAVKATSCDVGSDTHDGDVRAVGGTVATHHNDLTPRMDAAANRAWLRERFGEPVLIEPPVDHYEPNAFKRMAADTAARHWADDSRKRRKVGGFGTWTSQTDSDGENG